MEKGILCLLLSGLATWALFPGFIGFLQKIKAGQFVRAEGPQDHLAKAGTPNLGGILFLLTATAIILLFVGNSTEIWVFLGLVWGNALIGLADDWIKNKRHGSLGLKARGKLLFQIILGAALGFYLVKNLGLYGGLKIPFLGTVNLGIWSAVLAALVMVAAVNAVNLTDGLDGLAAGLSAIAFIAFSIIAYKSARPDLGLAALALAGACFAFLWFNFNPAKIFMGDVGSLALGAALATLAVLTRSELYLLIIGGIFLIETLSVIVQVTYFKATHGRRVFKMSPLHHHYCLLGTPEALVTVRFWLAGLLLGGAGLWLYLRLERWM